MSARPTTASEAETELLNSLEERRALGQAYVEWGQSEIRSAEAGLRALHSTLREGQDQESLLAGLVHQSNSRKRPRIWSEADLQEEEEQEDE